MSLTYLSPSCQMKMNLRIRKKAVRSMAGNKASILPEELLAKRARNQSANLECGA